MKPIFKQPRLSPTMFFILLLTTLSGLDFLVTPYDVAKISGPSAYWAVLLSLVLILPLIGLVILFKNRFPDEDLFQVASRVLGKPLALLGNLSFLGVFLIWLVTVVPNACYLISTYLLDRTPVMVIEIMLLAAVGYIAVAGLKAVCRMAAFIFIPTIVFRLAMQLLSFQNMTLSFLQPVFSMHPLSYLNGGIATLSNFIPLSTAFLIYPLLKKPGKLSAGLLGAAASGTLLLFLSVVGSIGIFSAPVCQRFIWPNLEAVHSLSIPYLVMEQFGLLFVMVWLTMFLIAVAYYFVILAGGLTQQFSALNFHYTIIGLLILAGIGGLIVFPNTYRLNTVFTSIRHYAIFPVVIYPFIVYVIALFRGKRGRIHEA